MENKEAPVASERRKPTLVWNKDINILQNVLYIMHDISQNEYMREWQQERMTNISARLDGSFSGSGTAKGLDEAFAKLSGLDEEYQQLCKDYGGQLKEAQKILRGIKSRSMKSFVIMRYMMKKSDIQIRKDLNMSRRSFEQAKESVENAPNMAAVEWKERYVMADPETEENKNPQI